MKKRIYKLFVFINDRKCHQLEIVINQSSFDNLSGLCRVSKMVIISIDFGFVDIL